MEINRELLDRQIVDRHGRLVGKVDDLEFALDDDGVPYLRSILVGQIALGRRVGGPLGRLLIALVHRVSGGAPSPARLIPFRLVDAVGSAVLLRVAAADLPEPPMERGLRERFISRIPGSGRAGG